MARYVCRFSCGDASAVATKLTLAQHSATAEVVIINAFIKEEDPDNRRFLSDCEKWFGQKIIVMQDEKFGASTDEVWKKERFMMSRQGAPCSRALKRKVMDAFNEPGDILVLGYTIDEQDRYDDFVEAWPTLKISAPLIEAGLSKSDCHALVERAGIDRPISYRLGFNNANCRGCIKGGMGYWNKVRVVWPERYQDVMDIQESLGPGAYTFRDHKTGERFGLKQLRPDQGRFEDEPDISCSLFCEAADKVFSA